MGLIVALLATSACAHSGPGASHVAITQAPPTAFGIPVYPGVEADRGGSFVTRRGRGITEVAAFQSTDSFERVERFYRRRLPAGSQTVSAATADGMAATFEFGTRGGRTTVEIASSKPRETGILVKRVRPSL